MLPLCGNLNFTLGLIELPVYKDSTNEESESKWSGLEILLTSLDLFNYLAYSSIMNG